MEIKDILFFIGCATLFSVAVMFVVSLSKIYRIRKAQNAFKDVTVACAGSGESEYPFSKRIRSSELVNVWNLIDSQENPSLYTPYIVKGNSMQYANLNPNDILIAKRQDIRTASDSFPSIVVISISDAMPGTCQYKIRRAWRVVNENASLSQFENIVDDVLASDHFADLRIQAKSRCPNDNDLKSEIMEDFSRYGRDGDVLLSTTYKTDLQRIHFSLHKISSVVGVAEYVSAAPRDVD